ncbi:MAG: T9SS type A sorting domain-containing protein [Aureispira sp.]|nr:T9SS type A sorting domain-containing protein [Aureispira sp.]
MQRLLLFSGFLMMITTVHAQYGQSSIFSTQTGQSLLNSLVSTYKPSVVKDYDQARNILYGVVYNTNDSVYCVYTGYKKRLLPGMEARKSMTSTTYQPQVSAEHTFPQSKGASNGNAHDDMHHLFPVLQSVNGARSNHPYAEIPDNSSDSWYYLDQKLTGIPPMNKDLYSEFDGGADVFEPREDHKGNTARAMFYFYTMYKFEADNADANFFNSQKSTLCDWHKQDPVDYDEFRRNDIIAGYQQGKKNPFILDCSLAERTYCPGLAVNCNVGVEDLAAWGVEVYSSYPNPFEDKTTIHYELHRPQHVQLTVYNAQGQEIKVLRNEKQEAGEYFEEWTQPNLPSGAYFYKLVMTQNGKSLSMTKTMLKR